MFPRPAPVRFYCKHLGDNPALVRCMTANGSWQVRKRCNACGELFGSALKHVPGWENLPTVEGWNRNPPCEVCGAEPTTNHHWLPRHIANGAGLACDNWPQSYLCHKHHMEWHALVTPGLVSEADKQLRAKLPQLERARALMSGIGKGKAG